MFKGNLYDFDYSILSINTDIILIIFKGIFRLKYLQ
jgi:hypothetical protein